MSSSPRILRDLTAPDQVQRIGDVIPETTFGITAKDWWPFFRRDLDILKVRKLSDRQWKKALAIAIHRSIRPWNVAQIVARVR